MYTCPPRYSFTNTEKKWKYSFLMHEIRLCHSRFNTLFSPTASIYNVTYKLLAYVLWGDFIAVGYSDLCIQGKIVFIHFSRTCGNYSRGRL